MHKGRLEAFSDGVIAIIITIMVLEMKIPHGSAFSDLIPMCPILIAYVLSYIYVGIYWNNHHHLMQAVQKVDGSVLWANLHLLFWLSLVPFVTGWMGENHFSGAPVASYGFILFGAGTAYYILALRLLRLHGKDSALAHAMRSGMKEKASIALYLAAIVLSFFSAYLAFAIYAAVAAMWLLPDRRIEKTLQVS